MKKIFLIATFLVFASNVYAQITLKQEIESKTSGDPFYDEFYNINGDPDKTAVHKKMQEEAAQEEKILEQQAEIARRQRQNYNGNFWVEPGHGPISDGDGGPISYGDGPISYEDGPIRAGNGPISYGVGPGNPQ